MADATMSIAQSSGGIMPTKLTGRNAAVWKYDLLTALSVFALGQGASLQTSVLRLIAAVTARYDWRRDEISVGRAELMRLWQCSEPTVKREIRRLRELGLLILLRPGVRGRVAAYRLCRTAVERLTGAFWHFAGPHFAARMDSSSHTNTNPDTNVVGFPRQTDLPEIKGEIPPWAQIATGGDPVAYRNWFVHVTLRRESDTAIYNAPTSFVASQLETRFFRQMQEAARIAWPDILHMRIEAD